MSRISRLVVLVASVAAVVAAMAGTASAVTWDVSGTGSFTATAPAGTLTSTGVVLNCPGASATGAYTPGSFGTGTYSGISGAVNFTGCALAGQAVFVTCGYTLTATAQPVTTTLTTGNADVTCGVTLTASPATKLCHISGATHAIYHDRPTGVDTLTITTTSNLNIGGAGCTAGTNDNAAHLNELTFAITSSGGAGPMVHRTA